MKLSKLLFFFVISITACCFITACASRETEQTDEVPLVVEPAPVPTEPASVQLEQQEPLPVEPEPVVDETLRLEITPAFQKKLLVTFYDGVEDVYKAAIVKAIEDEYKLTVVTAELPFPESEMGMRDLLDDHMQELVNSTYRKGNPSVTRQLLSSWGLSEADLNTKEGRQQFGLNMYLMNGSDMESILMLFNSLKPQYHALNLIDDIRWEYELTPDYFGVLAVTAQDIFSGAYENDYTFGKTSGNIGLISTMRFTDDERGEKVFSARIAKQALATTAGILRLTKCTNADCVRSESDASAGQDAKSAHLCDECREKLNAKYAKSK